MPAPPLVDYLGLVMSPTVNPAQGDIPARGPSGGWTTIPTTGAPSGGKLRLNPDTGMPEWSSFTSVGKVDLLDYAAADRTGNSDTTPALLQAISDAASLGEPGYAHSRSARVNLGAGRFMLSSKIPIPDGVILEGDGWGSTMFFLSTTAWPDNCVFEPVNIDGTQEFIGLRGFVIYGQQGTANLPTSHQANGGITRTVLTTIVVPSTSTFDLVANGDITSFAFNGTLMVGNKRVIYQSRDASTSTFHNCFIINGFGASINAGDSISAVSTNNVRAIHTIGCAGPAFLRDLWISNFTGEGLLMGHNNAMVVENVVANYSNRDCILYTGDRSSNYFFGIAGQYSGHSNPTGVLQAAAPVSVAAGAAGSPNGAYRYVVTFVTSEGESTPGQECAQVTLTNQKGSITGIPTGPIGVFQRGIYRTAAGGASGTEKLVAYINDNTTTGFTDNVADGALGAAVPSVDTCNLFAGVHFEGQSAQPFFQGNLSILGLYSEQTAFDQACLWLDNIGNVAVDNLTISGGTSVALTVGGSVPNGNTHSNTTIDGLPASIMPLIKIGAQVKGSVIPGNTYVTNVNVPGNSITISRAASGTITTPITIDSSFVTQTLCRITSNQAAPLTLDGSHSASISLRMLRATQIGRRLLNDAVRGNVYPQNLTTLGLSRTRYETEDTSLSSIGPFVPGEVYFTNQQMSINGVIYTRVSTGVAGATFDVLEQQSWIRITDRERKLFLGSVTNLRESYNGREFSSATTLTAPSGTIIGAAVPGLSGESYGHATFFIGATAAAFASNNDGHWYIAVYDIGGNKITQSADQGISALAAFSQNPLALNSAIVPSGDSLYLVVVMIYLGTGTGGVAPTLKHTDPVTTAGLISGMPIRGFTAGAGNTSGTAPLSMGAQSAAGGIPYMALYT